MARRRRIREAEDDGEAEHFVIGALGMFESGQRVSSLGVTRAPARVSARQRERLNMQRRQHEGTAPARLLSCEVGSRRLHVLSAINAERVKKLHSIETA